MFKDTAHSTKKPGMKIASDNETLASGLEKALLDSYDIAFCSNSFSPDYCSKVVNRFEKSTFLNTRKDGVSGSEIGSTQFGKTGDEYMESSAATNAEIVRIYGGNNSPFLSLFTEAVKRFEKRGYLCRPAIFNGLAAPIGRMTRWGNGKNSSGIYVLRPHEDMSQVLLYDDWEISKLDRVVALNVYWQAKLGSGQLVVSSFLPQEKDRKKYGVVGTGYPYPNKVMDEFPSVSLPVSSGSVAIINGSRVHAVAYGKGDVRKRLISNIFFGLSHRTNEIIYWA